MDCRNPRTCVCCGTADSDREQAVIDAARALVLGHPGDRPTALMQLHATVRALDGDR